MIPKYDEENFINNLTNPIYSIMQQTQYQVLSVITNRIRNVGKLSATDAQQLSQLIRMEDLDTIESIIASGSNLSAKEVDSIIEQAAVNNDNLAEKYNKNTIYFHIAIVNYSKPCYIVYRNSNSTRKEI